MMTFDDFVGNTQAVDLLKMLCVDTKKHGMPFPHIGIFGPAGHGKTTLVTIVAQELDRRFVYVNSVAVRRPTLLRGLITHPENMAKGAIIFLDECHQLPKQIQDNLLSALEKPAILVTSFKDQVIHDPLPDHISFAFATTNKAMVRNTLLSRLEDIELGEYSTPEKQTIALGCLSRSGVDKDKIDMDAVIEIGRRARSGRHVIKLCDRILRHARVNNQEKITMQAVNDVCVSAGVDENGLTKLDKKLLSYLYSSGHVGIDNLEAYLNIPKNQIANIIEPWLVRHNLIIRQASGRVITDKGMQALQGKRIDYV